MIPDSTQKKGIPVIMVALALVFILGLSLRVAGIMREPLVRPDGNILWAHPDEYHQVEYAARIANHNFAWNDTSYAKPGVALKFWVAIFFLIFNTITPIPVTQLLVLKVSQFLSAAIGASTIIAVFFFGKELYGRRAGFIAALFFSVFMFHIKLSHYATPYAFTVLAWTLALLFLSRYCFFEKDNHDYQKMPLTPNQGMQHWSRRIQKQPFLVGFFWMAGIASSYLSLFLLVPISLALLLKWDMINDIIRKKVIVKKKLSLLFASAGNVLAGFFLGSIVFFPNAYLYPKSVFASFYWMLRTGSQGLYGIRGTKGLGFFGLQLVSYDNILWGIGLAAFLLFIASLLFLLHRHGKKDMVLITLVVLFAFYMGTKHLNLMRYHSMLYPAIAVMIGAFCDAMLNWRKQKAEKIVVYAIIVAAFLFSLVYSLMYVNILVEKDVRQAAGEWMQENIPPGTSVGHAPDAQTWMTAIIDNTSRYVSTMPPEYIVLYEPLFRPAKGYLYAGTHQKSDWGDTMPTKDVLQFYDALFRGKLPYHRVAVFNTTPHFWIFAWDESDAPYHLWAVSHPTIHIYKLKEEITEKPPAVDQKD